MIATIEKEEVQIPNIVNSGFTLGEKVCVVAPGPNGKNHYADIPDDFSIIVVNKAILIEEINPDWWVIAHADTSWFHIPDQQYKGVRVYSNGILDYITKTALTASEDNIYCFAAEKEPLQEEVVLPVKGCIRYGASVSAMAIQMAYNFGASEILLCGIDMSGNGYWDKSQNEDPEVLGVHGEIWDSVKRLNPLLHYMQNELNVNISTLSKTQLNVPYYK
jgi:hypothetical protein